MEDMSPVAATNFDRNYELHQWMDAEENAGAWPRRKDRPVITLQRSPESGTSRSQARVRHPGEPCREPGCHRLRPPHAAQVAAPDITWI